MLLNLKCHEEDKVFFDVEDVRLNVFISKDC